MCFLSFVQFRGSKGSAVGRGCNFTAVLLGLYLLKVPKILAPNPLSLRSVEPSEDELLSVLEALSLAA